MIAVEEDVPVFTAQISEYKEVLTDLIEQGLDPTDKLVELIEVINEFKQTTDFLYATHDTKIYKYSTPEPLHFAELIRILVDRSPKREIYILECIDRSMVAELAIY